MHRREDGNGGKCQKLPKILTPEDLWLGLLFPSFLVVFVTIDQRPDLKVLKNSDLLEHRDTAT